MNKLFKNIKLCLLFIRRDGVLKGLVNLSRLYTTRHRDTPQLISPTGYNAPIYFRPLTTDVHLIQSILYKEEYNIDVKGLEPEVIVDVGGNAGYASIFFANKYPTARIFSYEPEKKNYSLLEKNVISYDNVEPALAAIWGTATKLVPRYESSDAWSFSLKEHNGANQIAQKDLIDGVTLNGFLKKYKISSIDILKVDIEGGELSLFSGDCSWLHNVKILVIELHDRKLRGCSLALYSALVSEGIEFTQKNMDYNTVIYNEAYFE
jgi:FkbM family methyltransferase